MPLKKLLKTEPFSYELPDNRIAQRPVFPPEAAKLLVFSREKNQITDTTYASIGDFLKADDVLVFNNTKVIPARLFGTLKNASVELLLLRRIEDGLWTCLGKPMKKFQNGSVIEFGAGLIGTIEERTGEKEVRVRFTTHVETQLTIDEIIFEIGNMPIPPYIRGGKSDAQDKIDYQTIFAKHDGSIAAPTASLHFSEILKKNIIDLGVTLEEVTLHVGAASFLPLWDEGETEPSKTPGIELYKYNKALLERLKAKKTLGGRVIPVGTTVVRALESMSRFDAATNSDSDTSSLQETSLFITPGFEFHLCDTLVTNFHQPRTTHLLLVESFIGRKALQTIYDHAVASSYRFLSYGDGMMVI